jgi:hypothetical protein
MSDYMYLINNKAQPELNIYLVNGKVDNYRVKLEQDCQMIPEDWPQTRHTRDVETYEYLWNQS